MASLSEVVRALAGRAGVDAVVVASADGLPIDQAGERSLDAEALAALSTTFARDAARLGDAIGRGPAGTAVAELADGTLLAAPLGDGNVLVVLAGADADVGSLLFDLRRHRPAVAALL